MGNLMSQLQLVWKNGRPSGGGPVVPPTAMSEGARRRSRLSMGGGSGSNSLPTVLPKSKCWLRVGRLQRQHDWLLLEGELLSRLAGRQAPADEMERQLREINRIRGSPMALGRVEELFTNDHAIVSLFGSRIHYYVPVTSFVDKDKLRVAATALLRCRLQGRVPLCVVGVLGDETEVNTLSFLMTKRPSETFNDVGGLDNEVQEIKEAVELPLTRPELYDDVGIAPPKGVLLYGPPGTGKTLLAKAVANSTSASFIRASGSDLVRKHSGEGPQLVRQLFRMAEENAPAIVFLDEIDAIGHRNESSCKGEREVQRTLLELLNQLDGFDGRQGVQTILATNRIERLDPALIRAGRIDRKIELREADATQLRKVFAVHTSGMKLANDVSWEAIVAEASASVGELRVGADVRALCCEAGLLALRGRRLTVCLADFHAAIAALQAVKKHHDDVIAMFYL